MLRFASLAVVLAACSHASSGTTGADAGDDSAVVSCDTDPRVETYTANMTKTSASGAVKVTLVQSDPAPPTRGDNTWVVRVTDAAGAAIPGAVVTVSPFMPDHGHPSSVVPTVTPRADGALDVAHVYLFMPGVWRVTIAVARGDAGAPDSVAFVFCVAG